MTNPAYEATNSDVEKREEWAKNLESCRKTLIEMAELVGDDSLYDFIGQTWSSVHDILESLRKGCEIGSICKEASNG